MNENHDDDDDYDDDNNDDNGDLHVSTSKSNAFLPPGGAIIPPWDELADCSCPLTDHAHIPRPSHSLIAAAIPFMLTSSPAISPGIVSEETSSSS